MLLIVDDDPKFLQDAESALDCGRGVYLAGSAEHAKDLLATVGEEFCLALIDLDLPRQDGISLIRELRQHCPDLPTIAIGGGVPERVLETARELGAVETLRKPITPEWNRAIGRFCCRAKVG